MESIRNYVWLLEVRPKGSPQAIAQMGSGVVVSLYQENKPDSQRRYLLTCRHVIRSADSQGVQGYGDPLGEILCWKPNLGYTCPTEIPSRQSGVCPGAWTAKVSDLTLQASGDVPADKRHPARDWVLLEVGSPDLRDDFQVEAYVPNWAEIMEGDVMDIVGFPGGSLTWRCGDLVQNIISPHAEAQRSGPTGTLKLNGASSGPGMSGGGAFNSRGFLVGIHRSATGLELATGAISAAYISTELHALGWEVRMAAADPVADIRQNSQEVSDAFDSLTGMNVNLLAAAKPDNLAELAAALEDLKTDLSVIRDCKAAHEILLHQAGLRVRPLLAAVTKMASSGNATDAALEASNLQNLLLGDATAFQAIAAKCPLVESAARLANDLLAVVKLLGDPATTSATAEMAIRITLQRIIATGPADFQHEISRKARKLSFDKISVLVADLLTDRMIPAGLGLEGMMKLIPLKDEVSRLVMEHEAWQDFDRELRPIEEKIRGVEKGHEADLPDIQYLVGMLAPYIQNLQATQTGYTNDFSDLMSSINSLIATMNNSAPEPTTAIKYFDATRSKSDHLFNLADRRLLTACESVTTIIGPIENLLKTIS